MKREELKELLEELYDRYNRVEFIEDDPISIPHAFHEKEDIEVAGFFSAILAWGQRPQIIKSAKALMEVMDNAPYDFVMHASESELKRLNKFYYRTFQSVDALFFVQVLRSVYKLGGLEALFTQSVQQGGVFEALTALFNQFQSVPHQNRSMKHLANVQKGSSAKRLNMYLRWMVRLDNRGVDFGIWKNISPSELYLPLDVHTGNSARYLGILKRKQNDWKAVEELTQNLQKFDRMDPVKYDFALFGGGVEKIFT